jgi:hypothetical protein
VPHSKGKKKNILDSITSTNPYFELSYGDSDASSAERNQRIRCLEIAAATCNFAEADRVVEYAKRYWHFVRQGD